MSDFLDKLGAAARRAADTVSTDLSIVAHEQKVREGYQALGKLYYRYVSSGLAPEGVEFDQQVALVAGELDRIAQLKAHKDVTD